MSTRDRIRIAGTLMVAVAVVGFMTVADDLRHKGELIGVGTILLVGLLLLAASFIVGRRDKAL